MSVSSDKLRRLYPEFEDTTEFNDTLVDEFIGHASAELNAERWGVHFERGSLALAAHMLALAKRSSAAAGSNAGAGQGGVSQLRTGDEQITFGAVGAATADGYETSLRTTPYGLEFLRLANRVVASPLMAC